VHTDKRTLLILGLLKIAGHRTEVVVVVDHILAHFHLHTMTTHPHRIPRIPLHPAIRRVQEDGLPDSGQALDWVVLLHRCGIEAGQILLPRPVPVKDSMIGRGCEWKIVEAYSVAGGYLDRDGELRLLGDGSLLPKLEARIRVLGHLDWDRQEEAQVWVPRMCGEQTCDITVTATNFARFIRM
jgi:hypothetical protein